MLFKYSGVEKIWGLRETQMEQQYSEGCPFEVLCQELQEISFFFSFSFKSDFSTH